MLAIVYGLAAAVTYGAADFLGGLMSRRVDSVIVVFLSQLFGAAPLAVAVVALGGELTPSALAWGAASGVAGGAGVLFLFRALAKGRMSALAPVTALEAAGIPVVFGLMTGEEPRLLVLVGAVVALGAVALISSTPGGHESSEEVVAGGLGDALLAGACFGAFFILLAETDDASGMWPLAGARVGSLVLVTTLLVVSSRRPVAPRNAMPGIAAAGCLDVAANICYVLSSRAGFLAVAAVLTSLYPGATVVLARVVLRERFTRPQLVGLGLGGVGVALIGAG